MPLYEFECMECGQVFEKLFLRASRKPELICPNCGSSKAEEKLSTFASASSSKSAGSSQNNCAPSGGG